MKLQASKKQQEHILNLLDKYGCEGIFVCDDEILNGVDGEYTNVPFDLMAEIVDYLRTNDKKDDLFEECWKAYRRKGVKKQAKTQWIKLTDEEKKNVLPHIKVYVATREVKFQKDFERYLRDKVFNEVIYDGNFITYDPNKENESNYLPEISPLLAWNDYYKCYMYLGFFDGHISDGYDDDTRPDGAKITLNNARGIVVWNKEQKQWIKQ